MATTENYSYLHTLALHYALPILCGDYRLAHLALDRLLAARDRVLHQLLGDRRPALAELAVADVGPQRPQRAPHVDPAVAVEATVLGRDDRLLQDLRDVLRRHRDAGLEALEHADLVARKSTRLNSSH